MTCTEANYQRHELLLTCTHHGGTEVLVRMADGCSGRLCPACLVALNVRDWPDVADRLAGPAHTLDLLQVLQAHAYRGMPPVSVSGGQL